MKVITKVSLLGVALAALSMTTPARADDQQHRNRLDLQRQMSETSALASTTVAVYAGGRGLGGETVSSRSTEPELKVCQDGHGRARLRFVQPE